MRPLLTTGLLTACAVGALALSPSAGNTNAPDAIAAPGERTVATLHAQGAQIYECKAQVAGAPAWQFREPIATLFADGKTVGRHFGGPSWELDDGSLVLGKVQERAAGASANDIPHLKLAATPRRGVGVLAGVTTILRINTRGGVMEGPCETAGAMLSVPYAADYVFTQRMRHAGAPGAR